MDLFTQEIIRIFMKFRGKTKAEFPCQFWDAVVITASDAAQREAYQMQIKAKVDAGDIPKVPYHVFSDPPGPYKVGCGGSTMHVLSLLDEMYGDELPKLHVLLINAGGQSQRLPSSSVLGKIFMVLPIACGVATPELENYKCAPLQLFDYKLACYLPFLRRMKPGILHVASDTIEIFDLGVNCGKDIEREPGIYDCWDFSQRGFTAAAHPSSLGIGETHGVFVLPSTETGCMDETTPLVEMKTCARVLQKPSIQKMKDACAVVKKGEEEFVYTDSFFYFDSAVSKKLIQFYKEIKPLQCEIDSYGDFLQPLGPLATIDFAENVKNVSKVEPSLIETRKKIYHLLKTEQLNVVVMNQSKFYHLGTMPEYIFHFCEDSALRKEMGFSKSVYNRLIDAHNSVDDEPPAKICRTLGQMDGCMVHNVLHPNSCIQSECIMEYCDFSIPVSVSKNSIISNCACDSATTNGKPLSIPPDSFLHSIAIQPGDKSDNETIQWVTIFFSLRDNIKAKDVDPDNDEGQLQLCGTSLFKVAHALGLDSALDLFPSRPDRNPTYTMWDAKLFPGFPTMAESFYASLKMMKSLMNSHSDSLEVPTSCSRYSMADVISQKHIKTMIGYRGKLSMKIKSQ